MGEKAETDRYFSGDLRARVRAPWPPMEWPVMDWRVVSRG